MGTVETETVTCYSVLPVVPIVKKFKGRAAFPAEKSKRFNMQASIQPGFKLQLDQ